MNEHEYKYSTSTRLHSWQEKDIPCNVHNSMCEYSERDTKIDYIITINIMHRLRCAETNGGEIMGAFLSPLVTIAHFNFARAVCDDVTCALAVNSWKPANRVS